MPTVNIFHQFKTPPEQLDNLVPELKTFIARELSCGDMTLTPEAVSVRFIEATGTGMIAPLEIEITAHAFTERIAKQDEICLHVRQFVKENLGDEYDVRVWLLLPELGHSWEGI